MFGGLAVSGKLLCVAHGHVRGHVFLVDLDERRPISLWEFSGPDGGYADAGAVAMDPAFGVFVPDTRNDTVRHFSLFGKDMGQLGIPADRAAGSVRRDRTGVLDRPRSAATFDGQLWVGCGERRLTRGLQVFDLRSGAVTRLRAFGDPEERFGAPRGLHAGPRGLLVADTLNGLVQRFTLDGRHVGVVACGHGDGMSRPVAVVPLGDDELLVADAGDRPGLRRLHLDGRELDVPAATRDAVPAPAALALDAAGRVLALEDDGVLVHRLHPDLTHDTLAVDLSGYLNGD